LPKTAIIILTNVAQNFADKLTTLPKTAIIILTNVAVT
jgi:hypothetical protein